MRKNHISIITVSYNSEATIERTIRSVLKQDIVCDAVEYLIVDGLSQDTTMNIVKKYEREFRNTNIFFHYVSEKDNGIYDAMNKGVGLCNGEWIIYLNSDDFFYDNHVLNKIYPYTRKAIDIIYGDCVYDSSTYREIKRANLELNTLKKNEFFCHQSAFTRRKLLLKRPFHLQWNRCADYDFFLEMYLQAHKFLYVPFCISVFSTEGVSQRNYWITCKQNYDIRKSYGLDNYSKSEIIMRTFFWTSRRYIQNLIKRTYVKNKDIESNMGDTDE